MNILIYVFFLFNCFAYGADYASDDSSDPEGSSASSEGEPEESFEDWSKRKIDFNFFPDPHAFFPSDHPALESPEAFQKWWKENNGQTIFGFRSFNRILGSIDHPNNPTEEEYIAVGMKHYLEGQYSEAINSYEAAISLDPNSVSYHSYKGIALYAQEKFPDALSCFNTAISLNSNNPDFYSKKGLTLYALGQFSDAEISYNMAISLNPNEAYYYFDLGVVLRDQGKISEAREAFDQALKLKPDEMAILIANEGGI